MKALGIFDHVDAKGNKSVKMFYDGKWQGSWRLENEIPANHPEFGLFEFETYDQFCKWIDPNQVDPLIQELIDERDEMGAEI